MGRFIVIAEVPRDAMPQTFTIGQLARASGVTAKTIRYYEAVGVLPRPSRTAAGYRRYDESGVDRVRFIGRARSLRLPLRDLKALTSILEGGPSATFRPRLLSVVREQLAALEQQRGELERLQRQLRQVLRRIATPSPRRHATACRCLEVEGAGAARSRRRPRY